MADKPIALNIETLAQSIELLESRNAFQDDIIEQLNQEITLHQVAIAQLKEQMQALARRVKESPSSSQVADISDDTPPPHY
ncbi:SlyX family protein [Thalassotalea profundi]|uniref:Protein SlyX homolog n=1 Tax=Thalassotalea profundi TaxID=2036687 RepID=A0ABQ3J467_9GAMM|nr:SlyX family protein [Thalassotalea profundi]GHE99967.1 protein SlyX [Thalassotalea profundi]